MSGKYKLLTGSSSSLKRAIEQNPLDSEDNIVIEDIFLLVLINLIYCESDATKNISQ